MATAIDVTDHTFAQHVMQAEQPVLVDFWAPHCSACRTISPIVDELAREYDGQLKVVKVNTDENPISPSQFGVRAIPNLLLLKRGQVQDQLIGAVPKQRLVTIIERLLG